MPAVRRATPRPGGPAAPRRGSSGCGQGEPAALPDDSGRRWRPRGGRCSASARPARRACSSGSTSSRATGANAEPELPRGAVPRFHAIMRGRPRALPDRRAGAVADRPALSERDGRAGRSTRPSRGARGARGRRRRVAPARLRPPEPLRRTRAGGPSSRARSRGRWSASSTPGRRCFAGSGTRAAGLRPALQHIHGGQYDALAQRYDVVCGGPETVARARLQSDPAVARGRRLSPSYPPLYGRAAQVHEAASGWSRRSCAPASRHAALGLGGRPGLRGDLRRIAEGIGPFGVHLGGAPRRRRGQPVKVVSVLTTGRGRRSRVRRRRDARRARGARARGRDAVRPARASGATRAYRCGRSRSAPSSRPGPTRCSQPRRRCCSRGCAARSSARRRTTRCSCTSRRSSCSPPRCRARLRPTLAWAEWGPVPFPMRRGLPNRALPARRAAASTPCWRSRRGRGRR